MVQSVNNLKWNISRRALDTRKRNHPTFVYTVELESDILFKQNPDLMLKPIPEKSKANIVRSSGNNPFIIGMGPAGLFCALAMVENGLKPYIFDRGDKLKNRTEAVNDFWKKGILNPNSNVQYGEGGAGAFSDGKLTSRSDNETIRNIYELFIQFGAPEQIGWEALPHLGTDVIRQIVIKIREYLISKGSVFHYKSTLDNLTIHNNRISAVTINNENYNPEFVVLAIGNSARETYQMLFNNGISLESKPFAVGLRISHPQTWINKTIYGNEKWAEKLGAATYRLSANKSGKGTYTFCMCPGGFVIAASSEPDTIVTNGMSFSGRNNSTGNSAIVTNVSKLDFGNAVLDGIKFQKQIEAKAFRSGYAAPYQKSRDFMIGKLSGNQSIDCLFPNIKSAQLSDFFPTSIVHALKSSLHHFDKILPGFIIQGTLLAPETRTSAPIRILRNKQYLHCLNIYNLFPVGEGSGYAGGIISSAADGYRIGSTFHL